MATKITIEDEFGTHEFNAIDSDGIVICDDGNGNITVTEDTTEDELICDNCRNTFCLRNGYCPYE